jgi:hypothetical protein
MGALWPSRVRVGVRVASFAEDFNSRNAAVFETNSIGAMTAPVPFSRQAGVDSGTQWAWAPLNRHTPDRHGRVRLTAPTLPSIRDRRPARAWSAEAVPEVIQRSKRRATRHRRWPGPAWSVDAVDGGIQCTMASQRRAASLSLDL